MGNTLEVANLSADVVAEDAKWLMTNSDSLFNDSYLLEVNDSLTPTSSLKPTSNKNIEKPRALRNYNVSSKAMHLLEIYGKVGIEPIVSEGMFEKFVESNDLLSFKSIVDCRIRLLNRINLVILILVVFEYFDKLLYFLGTFA